MEESGFCSSETTLYVGNIQGYVVQVCPMSIILLQDTTILHRLEVFCCGITFVPITVQPKLSNYCSLNAPIDHNILFDEVVFILLGISKQPMEAETLKILVITLIKQLHDDCQSSDELDVLLKFTY